MTLLDAVTDSGDHPEADATVLMTGAGAPGASGIVRALRRAEGLDLRVVGVDMDPDAYGFSLVDAAYTVPPGSDDAFVPEVLDIVRREDVDVVLPLVTAELSAFAESKSRFAEEGATVMVSDPEALATANDKGRLYGRLAKETHPAAPEFVRVETADEFVDAVTSLGYPEKKVCFKQPVGSGMRGFRVLDPDTDRFDMLMNQKPTSAVTTLEDILPVLDQAEVFPELVVMEYLPGDEYSVDALVREDDVPIVVPRSRSKTRAGISFKGTVERDEELIERAREICDLLDVEYNVNLQFRYTDDGRPKVIEMNPRVSGTIVMCLGAGVNLPALGVTYALGHDLPDVDVSWGTRMSRYWDEVFYGPNAEPYTL